MRVILLAIVATCATALRAPVLSARAPRTVLRATALEVAIAKTNAEGCVAALENPTIPCASRSLAAAALDVAAAAAGTDGVALASEERRLARCYAALTERGLTPRFGSGIERPFDKTPMRTDAAIARATGNCTLDSFKPAANGVLPLVGAGLAAVEIGLAYALKLDSPAPLFAATAGFGLLDQVVFRGAGIETVALALNPASADRIIRHEAGHALLAYLLGCPLQGCVLSAREAVQGGGSGAAALNGAAGTAFFDPELNAAARVGRVKRSVVDRYSLIVMGGIAAEAMSYGFAEGGSDDENALIAFLGDAGFASSIEEVADQARWAAVNGLLLLREHRAEYERLVASLAATRARSIGTVVLAVEDA